MLEGAGATLGSTPIAGEMGAESGIVGLRGRVASRSRRYHALEPPRGTRASASFDALREPAHVPLPGSLAGMRCLNVSSADGFWALEMERRGAAEVVAVDLRPERLRRNGSAYELDPAEMGTFDFVFIDGVLMHLRDPVAALESIGRVLKGELLSVDAISPQLTLRHPKRPVATLEAAEGSPRWAPNLRAYRHLFSAAGLRVRGAGRPFLVRGPADVAELRRERQSPSWKLRSAARARLGSLHAWVLAGVD